MATNPVLYAIQNLQSGKSSGAFRGVRSTPNMRETPLPTIDSKRVEELMSQLDTVQSGYKETRTAQEARYAALPGMWAADYAAAGNYKPGTKYRDFLYDRAESYQNEWRALPSQINSGVSGYKAAVTPLQTERDKLIGDYSSQANAAGYLAQGAASESATPSVSQGASLAATDLYSEDLESQVLGRKQALQVEPEDDLVSGAMQSSLYKGI